MFHYFENLASRVTTNTVFQKLPKQRMFAIASAFRSRCKIFILRLKFRNNDVLSGFKIVCKDR